MKRLNSAERDEDVSAAALERAVALAAAALTVLSLDHYDEYYVAAVVNVIVAAAVEDGVDGFVASFVDVVVGQFVGNAAIAADEREEQDPQRQRDDGDVAAVAAEIVAALTVAVVLVAAA